VNVSPAMAVILTQILNFNLHPSVRKIYLKGKAYELIGLYFNRPAEADIEQCPFLDDEDNVKKDKNWPKRLFFREWRNLQHFENLPMRLA